MKNLLPWGLVLLTLIMAQCQPANQPDIQYHISPEHNGVEAQLRVDMTFKPSPTGHTRVYYQNDAWGETGLFDCIEEVQILDSEGRVEIERDSGWVDITHPQKLDALTLSYNIRQDTPEDDKNGDTYRPIIQDSHFHIFSHNFFMLPEAMEKESAAPFDILLEWEEFPEKYTIHNSFGSNSKTQYLRDINAQKFHSAVFVGGDFKVLQDSIQKNLISLAIRGEWIPFQEDQVQALLSETIRAQRNFWEDHSQDYFTVTMRPFHQERGSSFQGTGLTNSFATTISNNSDTQFEQLVYLFNHELMHNWIGHTIENENEEEQYWFSEGFTEYYTFKNIARNRIAGLGMEYFLEGLNEKIRKLYASPVRNAPNEAINYENFWSDRNYEKLPYQRGFLFAFYLDQKIAQQSEGTASLDSVMRELLKQSREGQRLSGETFIKAVTPYYENIAKDYQRFIIDGNDLPLKELFESNGWDFDDKAPLFDLGFEWNADKSQILKVDGQSAAYKAGLRTGDKVYSRSIYFDRTDKQVELGILRNGQKLDLAYFPIKLAEVPQLTDTLELF